MKKEKELTAQLIELLGKQNATPEEKRLQAHIRAALLVENVFDYINEVRSVYYGWGRIKTETVKGVIAYAKAENEAQIRIANMPDGKKEEIVKQMNEQLYVAEIRVLGALAYLGLLE